VLRFFSNIRYRLAAENKVTRYLRYAIGEIMLVVIGILIALQVNNWNENRKERIQERKYLLRFDAELSTDLENIASSISMNKDRIQRAEFLMRTIGTPRLAEDSSSYFIRSIEYAGYTNFPVIADNTFEEIKSSGKLSLIRNEELRSALQQYHSWSLDRGQYDFIRHDIQLNYLHERQGILSPTQQIDMGSFRASTHYSIDEAIQAYERMIKKPGFLELLPTVIQSQIRAEESFDNIYNRATTLKTMIKTELGRQNTN